MESDGRDGKGTKRTDNSQVTTARESLKRLWQTPEIFEEDYRETEIGVLGQADMDGFS